MLLLITYDHSLVRWTGITVSKEQLAEATQRVKAAGLSDRVTLLFCDYRWVYAYISARIGRNLEFQANNDCVC